MSHCKQELVRLHRHSIGSLLETQDSDLTFAFSLPLVFLTDKKSRHGDDDSGMGPSISTGSKSTMVSEVTQVSQYAVTMSVQSQTLNN